MNISLINQTHSHRFGTELELILADPAWHSLEFAVAWVRRSATERLLPVLEAFLRRGGLIRGTVGVDIQNTSEEGLDDLLKLAQMGDAKFTVYHNESTDTTFHPKVYLLQSTATANLIIGSPNLTAAALFSNTEAAISVAASRTHPMVNQALQMLRHWRDDSRPVVRALDRQLLDQLVAEGYVKSEAVLRAARVRTSSRGGTQTRLFGREAVPRPPRLLSDHKHAKNQDGAVLIMRLRRASATARRTQVQIPIRLLETNFFAGIEAVVSRHSRLEHRLRPARARNSVNTIKLELPEIDAHRDPVIRLERSGGQIHYSAFDAESDEGAQIMAALRAGRAAATNKTVLTLPRAPDQSTWYRFI